MKEAPDNSRHPDPPAPLTDPDYSGVTLFTDLTPGQRLDWLCQAVEFTHRYGGRAARKPSPCKKSILPP